METSILSKLLSNNEDLETIHRKNLKNAKIKPPSCKGFIGTTYVLNSFQLNTHKHSKIVSLYKVLAACFLKKLHSQMKLLPKKKSFNSWKCNYSWLTKMDQLYFILAVKSKTKYTNFSFPMRRASSSAKAWPGWSPSVASMIRDAYWYKCQKMREVDQSFFIQYIWKEK